MSPQESSSKPVAEEESSDPFEKQPKKDPFKPTRPEKLREFDEKIIEPEFGQDYALGSLETELKRTQCQLSKARWEFMVFVRTGRLPGERRIPGG